MQFLSIRQRLHHHKHIPTILKTLHMLDHMLMVHPRHYRNLILHNHHLTLVYPFFSYNFDSHFFTCLFFIEKDHGAECSLAEDFIGGFVLFADGDGSFMILDKCGIASTLDSVLAMNLD
jgi:hypothetical protein